MWKPYILLLAVTTVCGGPTCPEGSVYNSDFESCYKHVQEPKSFFEAEVDCVDNGGHLASIKGNEENAFVRDLAESTSARDELYYWIGPDTTYSKWASGQTALIGCPAITPCSGLWAKVDCYFRAPYICKINPFNCPDCPTCPAPHNYCDSTWSYLEETKSCYKGFFKSNWDKAEEKCKSFGSHLASIHSNVENDFIVDLVAIGVDGQYTTSNMTWFGLRRNPPGSDKFEYTDGTKFDAKLFNKWAQGEPNNKANNENCVQVMSDQCRADAKGNKVDCTKFWNDLDCKHELRRFVCKKPANKG